MEMSIKTNHLWRCEKCGQTKEHFDKDYLERIENDHVCNPILYNIIRGIDTEYKRNGLIVNNNGAKSDVARYLGVSEDLAHEILIEMEDLKLATFAIPFRV